VTRLPCSTGPLWLICKPLIASGSAAGSSITTIVSCVTMLTPLRAVTRAQ
jgi:hypothetical protein